MSTTVNGWSIGLAFKRIWAKSLLRAGAGARGRSGSLFVLSVFMALVVAGAGICVEGSKWSGQFLGEKGGSIIVLFLFVVAGVLTSCLRWAPKALRRAGVRMVSTGDRLAEEVKAQEEAWALDQSLPKASDSKKTASKRL